MVIHEFNAFKIMYRFISWRKFKKKKAFKKALNHLSSTGIEFLYQLGHLLSIFITCCTTCINFCAICVMLCPFKKIYIFNFILKTTMPWVVFHFWFDNLEDKRNLNCKIYQLNNDVHQWPLEWGQICKEKASFSKLFLFIPTRGEGKKE